MRIQLVKSVSFKLSNIGVLVYGVPCGINYRSSKTKKKQMERNVLHWNTSPPFQLEYTQPNVSSGPLGHQDLQIFDHLCVEQYGLNADEFISCTRGFHGILKRGRDSQRLPWKSITNIARSTL